MPNVWTKLRAKPGKDIAIFGGGGLFRSLLEAGLVDRIDLRRSLARNQDSRPLTAARESARAHRRAIHSR